MTHDPTDLVDTFTNDDLDRLSFDAMIERLAAEEEEAARTLRRAGRPARRPANEWE